MVTWDPDRYLTYAAERGRPFADLVARVSIADPADVLDLGCGPGNLTRTLAEIWPQARLRGLDSSAEMIEQARRDVPGVAFEVGDLREWAAGDEQVDLLVSNAALQWVPGHLDLLPAIADRVRPGGVLAFQVPGNQGAPSQTLRLELAARAPFAEHLQGIEEISSHDPADYLDVLATRGWTVDAWTTTYLHVLPGDDPVFDWFAGTGLRPTLQALTDGLRPRFETELKALLREAFPRHEYGTVMPFRRVFVVARRAA